MICYRDDLQGLSPEMLVGFFEGWPDPPDSGTLLRILRGSSHIWLAEDGGRIVGFVNALSDGVLTAYIPLLEVLPEYRRRGIGGELVRRMLKTLDGHYMVDLLCDGDMMPFYRRHGMRDASGSMLRNYNMQRGMPG